MIDDVEIEPRRVETGAAGDQDMADAAALFRAEGQAVRARRASSGAAASKTFMRSAVEGKCPLA